MSCVVYDNIYNIKQIVFVLYIYVCVIGIKDISFLLDLF